MGDNAADSAVAVDAQGLASNCRTHAHLPLAPLERLHLLRNLTRRGEDQTPREFGRGVRRRVSVLVRRDDDAAGGARVDVDVRVDGALADQAQLGQPFEQRRPDLRPLTDQNERLGVLQPIRQFVRVLDVVGEDLGVVPVQLCERRQRAHRVEVVVEDCDLHATSLQAGPTACSVASWASRQHRHQVYVARTGPVRSSRVHVS
jgi:hypothetical protein